MQGLVKDDARVSTDLATSRTADLSGVATAKTDSVICAINDAIAERIGRQKFNIWFKNSTRLTFKDGLLKVGAANQFISTWLESHYRGQVAEAARSVVGEGYRLTFAVDPQVSSFSQGPHHRIQLSTPIHRGSTFFAPHSAAVSQPASSPGRLLKHRFDTFVVGPSNQLAFNAAKAVVCDKQSPFNPLFIHGGYGLGKTHLLQGICNETRCNRPTAEWLYMSAEDFANQFVLALKTRTLEAFRRRMRQTDLLAIDDIHFLASKPATQDEFLFTFNALDLAGRQVVLASDSHPKMIDQLCEKLVNRFVSGMVVKIDAPDFSMRCEIVRRYAQTLNKTIPEEVVSFIADNIKSSIRELQGAVLKLSAITSLQSPSAGACPPKGPLRPRSEASEVSPRADVKIDLAMAGMVLAEHVERLPAAASLSGIESAVCSFFSVSPSAIHSSKKDKTVALARHFSMYLTRKHTRLSSSEIGRLSGGKNHATVLIACKKIDDVISRNASLNWQGPTGNKVLPARAILEQLENNIRG